MLTIPLPLALGRFKRVPQRATEVWQGGIFKLPAWVENPDDPDAPPTRPSAALWTSLRAGLAHRELATDNPATPELALDGLLEFGLRYSDEVGRPVRVEVTDTALAEFSRSLAGASVGVEVVDDVPQARAVLRAIATDALGGDLPGYLDAPGVTLDDEISRGTVRRFDAARLRHVTHLLRALADVTDEELDAGRWLHRIETPGGTVDVRLVLPLLLEAEAGVRRPAPPMTARLAERAGVRVARLPEGQSFESLDEVNAAIARAQEEGLFEKDAEEAAGRRLTPVERVFPVFPGNHAHRVL